MNRNPPDAKLLAEFQAFVASPIVRINGVRLGKDTVVQFVFKLEAATPCVQAFLWTVILPEDVYVFSQGIGIDANRVSALNLMLEVFRPKPVETGTPASTLPLSATTDDSQNLFPRSQAPVIPSSPPEALTNRRSIPREQRWSICAVPEAKALLEESKSSSRSADNAPRKRILERLISRPDRRLPLVLPENFKALDRLGANFPNFQPVIEEISLHLRFRFATDMPLELPPMLLAGPPGIGKTEFARRLAEALGLYFELRSLAEMTTSVAITGNHTTWTGSTPGFIAKALAELPNESLPLILFDELDKVHRHGNHPPDTALLGLLEPRTAEQFRDECLDLTLNVRPIVFMFTCNEVSDVQPAILSRLRVVDVKAPNAEQMPAVVRSIDRSVRESNPAIARLFHPLSPAVIASLKTVNPRQLCGLLPQVYGLAAIRLGVIRSKRRVHLKHVELALTQRQVKSDVGFGFGFASALVAQC